MPYSFSISSIRGTVFLPRIPFEWTFVNSVLERFVGFIPTVFGSPQVDGNIVYGPGDWELRSPDGTKRVVFQAQKVDYIEISEKEFSREAIDAFATQCKDFFSSLIENRGQLSTRLAIAPSFVCLQPFAESKSFLETIYPESKRIYEGEELDSCEFSHVFRPTKTIADTAIKLNYLSKFGIETQISIIDGVANQQQRIKADFDINTFPANGLAFSVASLQDFFNQAADFCVDFYDFYFEN